jgi:hypothetical protein
MTNPFRMEEVNDFINRAINTNRHNVIIIWAPLGEGKTTLMLRLLHYQVPDWPTVLSFVLEPKTCLKCGKSWDANLPFKFEVICPECAAKARKTNFKEAFELARKNWWVDPFPVDSRTGQLISWPADQQFIVCEGKARGKIVQRYPYLNFSFHELKNTLTNAVETRIRLPIIDWDDPAAYFHRSNIQYMHPEVKNFFSRYTFIRQYVANLVVAVPAPEFVPSQLALYCTADILLKERGKGDFDEKKAVRSFYGRAQSWTKSYDQYDTGWRQLPDEWMNAYEEIRHAHVVEAYEHPEEIFMTTMPKTKEFTEDESLLGS